jgi:uncharacterized membrane protein
MGSAYLWLKLVHIVAAIVAVGANVTYFVWLSRAKTGTSVDGYTLDGLRALDARLANPAYVVLPITGIAMVLVEDLAFSSFWIATAIVLYIAMATFAGLFFTPSLKRQIAIAQAEGRTDESYRAAARRTTTTGIITMAFIALILYLMVIKPNP